MCGGLSESTVRRLIAQGAFPRPIVLSRNRHGRPARVAFVYEELLAWVAARIQTDRRRT
jgi:predicted DNA-binding transcriptional regulator AlpA